MIIIYGCDKSVIKLCNISIGNLIYFCLLLVYFFYCFKVKFGIWNVRLIKNKIVRFCEIIFINNFDFFVVLELWLIKDVFYFLVVDVLVLFKYFFVFEIFC